MASSTVIMRGFPWLGGALEASARWRDYGAASIAPQRHIAETGSRQHGWHRRIGQGEALPVSFERLFHPRGIAIIGASADLSRISGQPIKALTAAGYTGGIFPVNPKYPQMHGLKCYPAAAAIDQPCDLAIVAVPAAAVAPAIRDCGKAG